MINKKTVATLLLTSICCSALAQSNRYIESNKTVRSIGVQGSAYFVTLVEELQTTCLNNIVYIAADKKNIYAHLLAAKITGKTLIRLDYLQEGGPGGQCYADIVEFN